MDENCLPPQVFDCSSAKPAAEDGRVEQPNSAIRGCHEEGSGGATAFKDFVKLHGHTKLILG
eukprot:359433-Chlamydomonas_euryale.AAC.4